MAEGEERHKSHRELPLSIIKSPLIADAETGEVNHDDVLGTEHTHDSHEHIKEMRHQESTVSLGGGVGRHPVFKRHAESTPSELFYDLFFVANLTTFTNAHEINDHNTLVSYVGFFIILWFTWLQVTLFDLRMSRDSLVDRFFKAIQFGVMIGFVVVGSQYDPDENIVDGQTMSLVLMGSRIALTLQYASSLFYLRHYPGARTPLILITTTTFLAAMFYLGISFAFNNVLGNPTKNYTYVAWYVVAFVETLVNIGSSSYWRQLSFKGTHIVERMSLLTLIILGEGIIGLCERVQTVAEAQRYTYGINSDFAGVIIAAILLIYFLYMLYFDTLPEEHFGTIRQQIWAFMHFPLHVTLVLFLEGSSSFIIWGKGILAVDNFTNQLNQTPLFATVTNNNWSGDITPNTTEAFTSAASSLNATFNAFFADWGTQGAEGMDVSTEVYNVIAQINNGTTEDPDTINAGILQIAINSIQVIFNAYNIEAAPEQNSGADTPDSDSFDSSVEAFMAFFKLYDLVLLYFFLCGGACLLVLGGLYCLNNRSWSGKFDWVRMASFFVIGSFLALLSIMDIGAKNEDGPGFNLLISLWVIPTAMLCLFTVVAILHAPIRW